MATSIDFRGIRKAYGDNVVIPGLDLHVREGEFFTLLGPSGCGKTTLLRMIAGFNAITDGTIAFGDTVINNLLPSKRDIGMVFQNYAIFPNLTVRGNILFGLKNRGLDRKQMAARADEIMDVVQIGELADRHPKNLSGGQQQRVALARAIVIRPKLLLMDEPLSNLDAKLRVDMRTAIRQIQRDVGITTVYVTHDQEEAMAVSDRIAVMNGGVVEQVDSPRQIYLRPATRFVANFIGRINFFDAELEPGSGGWRIRIAHEPHGTIELPPELAHAVAGSGLSRVVVSARPGEIGLSMDGTGPRGTVVDATFLGEAVHYRVALESGHQVDLALSSLEAPEVDAGGQVRLVINPASINLFHPETGESLLPGAKTDGLS